MPNSRPTESCDELKASPASFPPPSHTHPLCPSLQFWWRFGYSTVLLCHFTSCCCCLQYRFLNFKYNFCLPSHCPNRGHSACTPLLSANKQKKTITRLFSSSLNPHVHISLFSTWTGQHCGPQVFPELGVAPMDCPAPLPLPDPGRPVHCLVQWWRVETSADGLWADPECYRRRTGSGNGVRVSGELHVWGFSWPPQ